APFRMLLERDARDVSATAEPRRGGNAIFFTWQCLVEHRYPAIRVGQGWSRRADMIGATLLAQHGARVVEGGLTLCHHRSDQKPASFDQSALEPELAGVILHRLVCRRWLLGELERSVARFAR